MAQNNPDISFLLLAYCQTDQANLAGILSDEISVSAGLDNQIGKLAMKLVLYSNQAYHKTMDFLGVGGMKIFRDDIYAKIEFPFIADRKFYKKQGYFDFPQKQYKVRITSWFLRTLCRLPFMRREIYENKIKTVMLAPFLKLLKKGNSN
jgi:hypothetical protein